MAELDLADLLVLGETQHVDAKGPCAFTGDCRVELAKDIIAMANTQDGGTIVIGVSEVDGSWRFDGVSPTDAASFDVSKIHDFVKHRAAPAVKLSSRTIERRGRLFVIIEVPEFDDQPHVCTKDAASGQDGSGHGGNELRVDDDTTQHTNALLDELGGLRVELEIEFGRERAMRAVRQARHSLALYQADLGTLKQWLWGIARRTSAGPAHGAPADEPQLEAAEDQRIRRLDACIGLDRLSEQVHQASGALRDLMTEHDRTRRAELVALVVGEVATLVADSARLTESDDVKAAAVVIDGVARTLSDGLLGRHQSELDKLAELATACEALPLASRGYTRSRTRALSSLARHLENLAEAPDAAAETTIRHLTIEVPTLPKASVRDSSRLTSALATRLRSYLQRHPLSDDADALAEHEWRERFGLEALKLGLATLGADGERRSELLAGLRQRRRRELEREKKHLADLVRQIETAAGDDTTEAAQWTALERVLFGTEAVAAEETS